MLDGMSIPMTLTAEPENIKRFGVILMVSIYSAGFAATVLTDILSLHFATLNRSVQLAVSIDFISVVLLPFVDLSVVFFLIGLTPFTKVASSRFEVLTNPAAMIGFESVFVFGKPFSSFGFALV